MANSKLIVVEGPQGVGKTTITDFLRHSIPYTNLYRLSGISDSSKEGYQKSVDMYNVLLDYLEQMANKNINLVFDRTFFTEENYCRLGKKEYSFTDAYYKLLERFSNLDFDIYYMNLYLGKEEMFDQRLNREGKANNKYASFSRENSLKQQEMYMEMADEIAEKYPNINVSNIDNSKDIEVVKEKIEEILGLREKVEPKKVDMDIE